MKRSLTASVLFSLALAALVPTVVVGVQAIRRAREAVREQVRGGHLALIRALGSDLDQRLQAARRGLDIAAQSWAEERSADTHDDAALARKTSRLLARIRRNVPILARLALFDVHGALLAGDALEPEAAVGAHSFGGYIGDLLTVDGRPRVRAVSQARSRTGELCGVFVAELDLLFIGDVLASARLGPGARLLVVDGDGRLVADSEASNEASPAALRGTHPGVEQALASTAEGSVEKDGVVAVYRNLSGYQSLRGVRWALIHEQPEEQAYASARETTRDTLLVGAVALVAVLLAGALLAARLTRPLRALAERADAIASGRPLAEVPSIQAAGEVGHLALRFEEMAERLEERERLRDALARGERLATIGTMAASVAHEVGNPLTTILGYANLLLEDKPTGHGDRRALELIADEAERLKKLSATMLDYARAESDRDTLEIADVNEVVEHTSELLGPTLRKQGVALELELAALLPRVKASSYALQQVLVNLVQNAAHAMPAGGTVSVRSRPCADGRVEVLVDDEGAGIDDALRARVFEPFYTTKAEGQGTGLGLAVCKHLVGRFGGSIELAARDRGRGTRFRVVLPGMPG